MNRKNFLGLFAGGFAAICGLSRKRDPKPSNPFDPSRIPSEIGHGYFHADGSSVWISEDGTITVTGNNITICGNAVMNGNQLTHTS
jgi:hypothetical protein